MGNDWKAGDAHPTVAAKMGAEVLALKVRVAELEEAARWRVTAKELPPVGEWVLGVRGEETPVVVSRWKGGWCTADGWGAPGPLHWQPIRKPGAP
jgi:hypothetical protein